MKRKCTRCGKCCRELIEIEVMKKEAASIPPEMLLRTNIVISELGLTRSRRPRFVMRQVQRLDGWYHCMALKDNRCSIYNNRPSMCETYLCADHPEHRYYDQDPALSKVVQAAFIEICLATPRRNPLRP